MTCETMYILRNTIGYTKKGREHMHPDNQGNAKSTKWRTVIQIVVASVFAGALTLLSLYVIHLESKLTSMQSSLDFAAEWVDSIQSTLDIQSPDPVFSIASFKLDYKKDDYGETYSGSVIITCDQTAPCIVILKTTLVSGGSAYTEAVSYSLLIVQNGVGKFTTYDWGKVGKLEKPEYQFEVVGYIQMETDVE